MPVHDVALSGGSVYTGSVEVPLHVSQALDPGASGKVFGPFFGIVYFLKSHSCSFGRG